MAALLLALPNEAFVLMLPDDLTELLGNLLENATEWAGKAVRISLSVDGETVIQIEDDGPGVPDGQAENLCRRGVRLDEQRQGTGLGLAIARDIAEAYHADLSFGRATLGGLAVTVRIPSAESSAFRGQPRR